MQLAQSPDAGGGLPPQAQTGLPAMAADLADIAPPPPAATVVQTAALGDTGSQQADALRAAGQQPPIVPAPAPATGVAPQMQPNIGALAPEGSPQDLAAAALAPAKEWAQIQEQRRARFQQQLSLQEEYRRNAAEFYSTMFDVAAKNFPGRPDLAAVFLQNQAAQRGIQLDPAVAAHLRQKIIDGQVTGKQLGELFMDPATPISTVERFGADLKLFDQLREGRAQADKAVQAVTSQKSKDALEVATRLRGLQRPLTADETTALSSQGYAVWPVQVPGAEKGQWMWMPGDAKTPPPGALANTPNVPPGLPTKPLTGEGVARAKVEAKTVGAGPQRLLAQIGTALGPINRLEQQLNAPQMSDAIAKMGPTFSVDLGPLGVRAMNEKEGPQHDSLTHPYNEMWHNYSKAGGQGMTPEEQQLMATLGTVSASGWQGLTSGIRNRAVIEDVKQHVPRPWDTPELIKEKIAWIKQWYQQIQKSAIEGSQTLHDLADENAGNPIHVGPAGAPVSGEAPAPGAAAAPTGESASSYRSPNDVRNAFRAGQISREDAAGILRSQFGMQ